MRKVAVTGGIGSGKSTVCSFLKELGACVVNADDLVARLLFPTHSVGQKIIELLGVDVVSGDTLDRKKIAEKVFNDYEKLRALEKIIHPLVFAEIECLYLKEKKEPKHPVFVVEVPLLYELGAEKEYDYVVSVVASEEVCRKRLEKKEHPSTDYDKRMKRQMSPKEKEQKADFIIHNDGSLEELKLRVKLLFAHLSEKE